MTSEERRRFLKLGTGTLAAAGLASILPPGIRRALAQATRLGTLADIEHVIILMQENRSFDHCFGMLPGVRGFADSCPAPLPNGKSVWYQPNLQLPLGLAWPTVTSIAAAQFSSYPAVSPTGKHLDVVMPYPLHPAENKAVNYQGVSLCHDWKGSQRSWEHWDAWIQKKGHWSMGYLKPADLPFYY